MSLRKAGLSPPYGAGAGWETGYGHVGEDTAAEGDVHEWHGLAYLQRTARERRNVFARLIEAETHSRGQISHALYDVGGEYRRNV